MGEGDEELGFIRLEFAEVPEDEMVARIFNYTERIIEIVRPRKVLYLAIDGVAVRSATGS